MCDFPILVKNDITRIYLEQAHNARDITEYFERHHDPNNTLCDQPDVKNVDRESRIKTEKV